MAWTYGFHNSLNGDRVYNAAQMSSIFEGLITDGVYQAVGNKLAVQPNNGMTIQIATGRGWFNERWVNNDSPLLLTLNNSDVVLNRYAAVCVRADNTDSARTTEPYIKYSDFATAPVKPTMERTNTVKEYCLAYIYIKAKATTITAADIEDTRQDKNLCGWVTGLIDQITPDTLYTQFKAQFDQWFSGLVDIIDSDVETTLVNAMAKNETVIINPTDWDDSNQCTVTVVGMTDTKSVIIEPDKESLKGYENAVIQCTGQAINSLTFKCDIKPDTAIKVNIVYMGQ